MGQGVLVVTEPHSELNAGLIVDFDSHILPYLTGMTGHSAVRVSQGLSLYGFRRLFLFVCLCLLSVLLVFCFCFCFCSAF